MSLISEMLSVQYLKILKDFVLFQYCFVTSEVLNLYEIELNPHFLRWQKNQQKTIKKNLVWFLMQSV